MRGVWVRLRGLPPQAARSLLEARSAGRSAGARPVTRHLAIFALGFLIGLLLNFLLTHPTASRQVSAPRPSPSEVRQLDATETTEAPTLRPSATPTTSSGAASATAATDPVPTVAPTPKPTKRPRATTRHVDGLSGLATWYPAGGPVAAAGPALRAALGHDWRGQTVRVCSGERCVTVQLIDWCACGDRHGQDTLLDLGLDAFTRLADPSAGVIDVTIR